MAEAPPSLSALCKELATVQRKWFKIGIYSGVPYEKLQEFEKADYPIAAVFNYCLKGNTDKPLTWNSIVDTLKHKDIEEDGLAEVINKKYCKTFETVGVKEKTREEIKQASSKRKAESLSSGCYLFVNISHLWIEGQMVSAKHLKDADIDNRFRIDFDMFVNLLTKGRNILGAYLYGSRPLVSDKFWKAARRKNFSVKLFQHSGTDQAFNTAMTMEIIETTKTIVHRTADLVFIIATGHRDLRPAIEHVLGRKIRVELWSWEESMSHEFRQLANTNPLFTASVLNGRRKTFSYNSCMFSQKSINPEKVIVYRDVPKSKIFVRELVEYLHQLMRLFYITPATAKEEGKQDLIVEFPKTNPDIVFQELKRLRNFPYEPCSYPEYKHNSIKIRQSMKLELTNRFEALGEINEESLAETPKLDVKATTTRLSPDIIPKVSTDQENKDDSEEDNSDWASPLTEVSTSLHDLSEEEELVEKIVTAIESNELIDRKHAHTMLTGPGESGKTSLLYRLLGKEKQLSISTGVAEPVAIVDVNSVTVFSSNKWQEVEYETSLVRQMNEGAQVLQPLQPNTESSSQEPTPYQAPDTVIPQAEPSEPLLPAQHISTTPITTESKQILKDTVRKHEKFLKSKYSLYIRDAGGQVEFQEMVSLLVFGASFFIFVFNACLGLKNTFNVCYRKSTEIKLYSSSITTKEALLRTLATVYAMKTSGEVPVRTHNPYVLIVGTHKDKLGEKAEEKIKELNKELDDLITSNGFEDLVQYADDENNQVMFTVDNIADSDEDFEPIREKITNLVCGRKEFNFKYPIKNLMFYLELQTDERTVLTLEECRRMAAKYNTVGDDVLQLLNFLHYRIGVIQFINIEGVQPVILKKPETLFNKVTDIVAKTFPRKAWTKKEKDDFEKKGILPKSAFESVIDSQDVFSCEEFIKILVHLHIIIPFTASESAQEEYYFIPCALSHAPNPPEDDEQESSVVPLAVTFKCKHCPKGLFGVLITHLMADKSTFTLNKERIYKDQISLTIKSADAQDRVTLKSCSSHFEIKFVPEGVENQENSATVNNKTCSWLRCKLENLIKESIDNLNYDEEKVAPQMSLKCAHCSRLHPVETVKSTNCLVIRCNEIHKRSPVPNKGRCWFHQGQFHQGTCEPNPIAATNSSISAPVVEMPPSLLGSMMTAQVGQEPQPQHQAFENRSVDNTQPSKDNIQPLNDNALEIGDLKDVLDEVESLSSKWRLFCIKLGLNDSTLDDIEQNNPKDVDMCLYKAMGEWLKLNYDHERHGRPSWKKIVEAAKRLNNRLSEKIAAAKIQ